MNSKQSLTKITTTAEFAERLRKVGTDLIDLSRELVAILDTNPAFTDELVDEGFDRRFINRLERFGRGHIHPSLLYATSPGGTRLISLPLSEQTKLIDDGVEVLDEDGSVTRKIPIHDLTTSQASRVFSRGRLRSLAEQRTVLQKKALIKAPVPKESWRVYKDHVITAHGEKLPRSLLLQWLSEMG